MYKQDGIITIKYPFSDKPQKAKLRPAIVISNKKSNSLDNDLLIAPITSTIRATPFSFPLDNIRPYKAFVIALIHNPKR